MKPVTTDRDIHRSGEFAERAMQLAAGSESFIFNVLRKDLYSDPIKSMLREYMVNALDEHRKGGITDIPIEVTLPTHFVPEVRIRDFAGGLSEEDVYKYFGQYGASGNRESNVAAGMYGLGCKSAFAYTDSYVVKSFHNGIEHTFNIYIDETEVGRVAKIGEQATDEPNGILITVPVKSYHVNDFYKKAVETMRFFKTKPIVKGVADQPVYEVRKVVISDDGWAYHGNGSPLAIMGEIAYPLDLDKMGNIEVWERQLLRSDLHLFFNIGDVQVTASREALQMSPYTVKAIREKLAIIKEQMIEQTTKAFEAAQTLMEAKALYYSVLMTGAGYGQIIRAANDKIVWNGIEIDDNVIRFGENSPHSVSIYTESYRRRGRGQVITLQKSTSLQCIEGQTLYFDDTDRTIVNYKRRATTLIEAGAKQVVILHTSDVQGLEKAIGVPVSTLSSYKAVTPTMPPTMRMLGNGVDKSKRAKHQRRVFELDLKKLARFVKGAASDVWTVKEKEVKGGVYIPIERFHPSLRRIDSLGELRDVIEALNNLGIRTEGVPFYGVKKGGQIEGLISFDAWLDRKLDSNAGMKQAHALSLAFGTRSLFNVEKIDESKLEGDAKTYVTLYNVARKLYNATIDNYRRQVFGVSGVEVSESQELLEMSKAFVAKYPMLKLVDSHSMGRDEVINYIREREEKVEQ